MTAAREFDQAVADAVAHTAKVRPIDFGFELDDGKHCENCWVSGRAARIKEDARSGRWLCHECEPNPTSDGLRRLRNGGLGEPL